MKEEIEVIEEELKEESKIMKLLKRTYIILIALFMMLLLLVNTNAGYHIFSVLNGKIVSSTMQTDYTFSLKNAGTVHFEAKVYEELKQIYLSNQKAEFKACLLGYKENKNYFVTGIYMPVVYNQDVFSVTSQICSNETIISLHSHPPLRCIFSEQDIKSYNLFKQVNPDGIIGLMCDTDRLSFFGYQQ